MSLRERVTALFRERPQTKPGKVPREVYQFLPDNLVIERSQACGRRRWTLYVVVLLIISAVVWSCLAEVDRIVSAQGKLAISTNPLVVQPFVKSIIRKLDVKMGNRVKAGEVLVVLEPTFAGSDVRQLRFKKCSLAAQLARINAEMRGEPYTQERVREYLVGEDAACLADEYALQIRLHEDRSKENIATLAYYDESMNKLQSEAANNKKELVELQGRLGALQELENMTSKVVDIDAAPKSQLLSVQNDRFEVSADAVRLENDNAEIFHQLSSVQAQKDAYINKRHSDLASEFLQVRREFEGVLEELRKAEMLNDLIELRAPMDAIVLEVAELSVGSVATEGKPLVALVPDNAELEAEVEISPSEIGYVRENAPARVKLGTLPFQKHGKIDAVVKTISEDVFKGEMSAKGDFVYRCRLRLPENAVEQLRNLPSGFALMPGMSLVAEINVGKRTVVEYFLYPILEGLDSGLREPK